jgi:hypothetical protein
MPTLRVPRQSPTHGGGVGVWACADAAARNAVTANADIIANAVFMGKSLPAP